MDSAQKRSGFRFYRDQDKIEKRRKLSEHSLSSDSTGDKLNESFKKLDIASFTGSRESQSPPNYLKIPIKTVSNAIPALHLEELGIQKYLNLNYDQNFSDLLKFNSINYKPKARMPKFYPFGVPANFNFLLDSSKKYLKDQIEEETKKYENNLIEKKLEKILLKKQPYPISKEERDKKVQLYLEKKQNRQWKGIKFRYQARKEQADQRLRIQGKFVKQPLSQSWEGLFEKKKMKKNIKEIGSCLQNFSDCI